MSRDDPRGSDGEPTASYPEWRNAVNPFVSDTRRQARVLAAVKMYDAGIVLVRCDECGYAHEVAVPDPEHLRHIHSKIGAAEEAIESLAVKVDEHIDETAHTEYTVGVDDLRLLDDLQTKAELLRP